MTHHPSRRVDALIDALLQLLVLAGLPLALWTLTGNPIPSRLPSGLDAQLWWNGVQTDPSAALDILPRIIADALWIAWAWYTAWFTLGLLWDALRLPAVALPRILVHLTPRVTVQALTVGAVAAATPAVHAAPAHAATTTTLPENLTGRLHLTAPAPHTGAPPTAPQRSNLPTRLIVPAALPRDALLHPVVEGDTLWNLAALYYGDGEQWHLIYAANAGRVQIDGGRLVSPDLIRPGWKLAIPGATATPPNPLPDRPTPTVATSASPGSPQSATAAVRAASHGHTTPAPSAPARPVVGRASTPPQHRPHNGSDPAHRPAADRAPRSVGWHLPGGGYIGITLIAAVAASAALLKTRRRLHPDTTAPLPSSAEHLAALHAASRRARALGNPHTDHRGETPPLYKPQPGVPMLGTYPHGDEEAWYDPGLQNGPIAVTGPGAPDVVRALALSMLAASDLELDLEPGISPIGLHVVLTDQALAADLLGARPEQHLPGWLHLTDTPQTAVAAFHAAARRRVALVADVDDYVPSDDEPFTMLIARADAYLHETIVEACMTDPTAGLGAILLGEPPQNPNTTTITIAQDGATTAMSGPRSSEIRGLDLYSTPRDTAADLFHLLYAAREVYRPHPPEREPEPDSAAPAPRVPRREETTLPADPAGGAVIAPHQEADAEDTAATDTQDTDSETAHDEPVLHDPRALAGSRLLLRVLGPIDILGADDTSARVRGDRTRAILALLALHPRGLSAGELLDLAWQGQVDDARARKEALYEAQRRVRTLLNTAAKTDGSDAGDMRPKANAYLLLDNASGRYHLDRDAVCTDLALQTRLEADVSRATDPAERLRLLTQATQLHRGPLADGLDDNGRDWLITARFEALVHAAHLHLRIAELVAGTDPATALDHVSRATALAADDHHTATEAIRIYQRLGRADLARAVARKAAT